MRRRSGRKRVLGTGRPLVLPDGPNQWWGLEFVSDALTDGRRFRILAVMDDNARENPVLLAGTPHTSLRATRELDRLISERSQPSTIASDNVLFAE
ncbi:hypothetical protein [Ruegeria lacuscaerulensis]|uniref:hypothetical protein n=1 Tax=Ruegeria lacuscaerulensis TaxID=55218 RepID=UPI00147BDFCE|nr:hypothetical protein [Ruegeria lacuscaerulensis]